METGYYLNLSRVNGINSWCGPFLTARHAFAHAYCADLVDGKKSDYSRGYMVDKAGEYRSITHSKYILEDIESAISEDRLVVDVVVSVPAIIYSNLRGTDGLLSL
jgi:hypothetical protein